MASSLALQHFAVLRVSYTEKSNSIVITCTTNNPCHLTCYYTAQEPVRHATSLVRRGVSLPWGAYWCFVAWNSVEQQEDGDTLRHTFEVPDWSYCQIRWFCFRGTVAGVLSPSVSAIFKHHHRGVIKTVNIGVSKKAYYRVARSANPGDPDVIYALAHNQALADNYHTTVIQYGQRVRVLGTYAYAMLRRTALHFWTQMLAPYTLLQAVLTLDMRKVGAPAGYSANWNWSVIVRAGQDLNAQITYPELINYSKLLALGTMIGAKYADDLPDPGNQDLWYIEVPLEFINLDGYTVFSSLTSKDIVATRPADNTIEELLFIADSFSFLHIAYSEH